MRRNLSPPKRLILVAAVIVLMIACNKDSYIKLERIILSTKEITIEKGEEKTLKLTYSPENATAQKVIWESSDALVVDVKDGLLKGVSAGEAYVVARCGEISDTCAVLVLARARGIRFDKTTTRLYAGKSDTISATIIPEDCTDSLFWVSSDESIAVVDSCVITGISTGMAVISARIGVHTEYRANCTVYVLPDIEAVDIGLSVKWGNLNIGAFTPEESGYYFAWGETEPKEEYSWKTYKWCSGGSMKRLTKYNNCDTLGVVDNLSVLELEDDAAHKYFGRGWRIPTDSERDEFIATARNSNYKWTYIKNLGWEIEYLGNGNSIYLPLSGEAARGPGVYGRYWSSTGGLGRSAYMASYFIVGEGKGSQGWGGGLRCNGYAIRPVTE